MDTSNKIVEAFARLQALGKNIPDMPFVEIVFSDEFESLRRLLQDISRKDLSGFKLPDAAFERDESGNLWLCQANLLHAKIDGLLGLFEIELADPKPKIGFHA
jgi:hypothetical protein